MDSSDYHCQTKRREFIKFTWVTATGLAFVPGAVFSETAPEITPVPSRTTGHESLKKPGIGLQKSAIEIVLPDIIYAIAGDTIQLFYRGMIKAVNPYIYNIVVSCSKGKQYPRYFEYLPATDDTGTSSFKIEIKSDDGTVLGSKSCTIVTKNIVRSPSEKKHILCVGDSLTAGGIWCREASRRLTGTGGNPEGSGLANISFLGRKTGEGTGWEGNGGWTWSSYATAGREAYKFFVSAVSSPPSIGAVYINNGIKYTVSEVNLTAGKGYISALSSAPPLAREGLTKESGNGDESIIFSSFKADSGNPFWEADKGRLDFPKYVNKYMNGKCDVIYFLLTWNGQTEWKTDFSDVIATAKLLIDHIHANYPQCKIKIMGIQVPSISGGMGANYGATGKGYADTFGMVVTALNMNRAYQDWCNEPAYKSFLEYTDVASQFDSENNMPEADKQVNTRSAKTEKIGTNGVHPATEGYYQIADVVYRNFVANFCQ